MMTEDRNHQLFYQMTRITKDRGALKHDDVLECVAGAVAFWTERLDQDTSGAEEDYRRDELNRELDKWMQDAGLSSGKPLNWTQNV